MWNPLFFSYSEKMWLRQLIFFLASLTLVISIAEAEQLELLAVKLSEGKADAPVATWQELSKQAKRAGIDLSQYLDQYVAAGQSGDEAFMLFFNSVRAPSCKNEYLIQRVRLQKSKFEVDGKRSPSDQTYLVEVFKLDSKKKMKGVDRHFRRYSLGQEYGRELFADFQIGCGEIRGHAEGPKWPFAKDKRYVLLQDYSSQSGLYDRVRFEDSESYRFKLRFDAQGKFFAEPPEFVARAVRRR